MFQSGSLDRAANFYEFTGIPNESEPIEIRPDGIGTIVLLRRTTTGQES
jgi:hypothetical protein